MRSKRGPAVRLLLTLWPACGRGGFFPASAVPEATIRLGTSPAQTRQSRPVVHTPTVVLVAHCVVVSSGYTHCLHTSAWPNLLSSINGAGVRTRTLLVLRYAGAVLL